MRVRLNTPELTRFIDEQVRAGHFATADDAIEAAVAQMKVDQDAVTLTDEDWAAIDESEAQIEKGQSVDFDTIAIKMRAKLGCK